MSRSSFLDDFRNWFAARAALLAVPLRITETGEHVIRLEFDGISCIEVLVQDPAPIAVLVVDLEDDGLAILKVFSSPPGDLSPREVCQQFENWISAELAVSVAIGLTPGQILYDAVLLCPSDDAAGYARMIPLRPPRPA